MKEKHPNRLNYLRWHHPRVCNTGTRQKQPGNQILLHTVLKQPNTADSGHAKVITNRPNQSV